MAMAMAMAVVKATAMAVAIALAMGYGDGPDCVSPKAATGFSHGDMMGVVLQARSTTP